MGDEQPPPAVVTEERRKEHDTAVTVAARYPAAAASPRTTRLALPAASRVSSRLRLRSSRSLRRPRRKTFFSFGKVEKPGRFQLMRDDTPSREEGRRRREQHHGPSNGHRTG